MTFVKEDQPRCQAGASLIKYKPVFSYDCKFFFVPSGLSVKVFSCASGECVRTFSKHKSEVVAVVRNPENVVQVLSCSDDGVILKWDPSDGSVLKRYEVPPGSQEDLPKEKHVVGFFAPRSSSTWFFLRRQQDACTASLEAQPSGSGESRVLVSKVTLGGSSPVSFSPSCGLYAAIHKYKLYVGSDLSSSAFSPKRFKCKGHKNGVTFTCVSWHPSEQSLATGDTLGCITLWQGLKEDVPVRSFYHWHSLPVADLAFSSSGRFLLSGGGECVLVKWDLASEGRQFLPRMGLPLCHVATSQDSGHVLTAHLDNCLQLVNAQLRVERIVQGLARSTSGLRGSLGLIHDPRSGSLVLGGRPGHLQFYHLREDKQLFSLDIVGQNYLSQEREGGIVNTEVTLAALAGDWLASVEHWSDADLGPETRLKFWRFDDALQNFVLDTSVYLPHSDGVTDLLLRPPSADGSQSLLAVTTGKDKKFRLWAPQRENQDSGGIVQSGATSWSWNCVGTGSYRSLPARRAAFSQDGSLLAVSFARSATLWSEDCCFRASLAHPRCPAHILAVAFGRSASSRLLVSCTDARLIVWDVVTLSVLWELEKTVTCLVWDPSSEVVAAFGQDGTLLVFEPKQREPVLECSLPSGCLPVTSAVFLPDALRATSVAENAAVSKPLTRLCFVSAGQELYTWNGEDQEADQELDSEMVRLQEVLPTTPFGALVAQEARSAVQVAEPEQQRLGSVGLKEVHQLLEVPSHTLPSMTSLYQNFLSAFLNRTPASKRLQSEKDEDEDMNNNEMDSDPDSEMEVDEELPKTLPQGQAEDIVEPDISTSNVKLVKEKHFSWLSKTESA